MEAITVDVDRLKDALTENMATHEADFEIAWEAYAKAAISNVEALLANAKSAKKGEPINLYIGLTAPSNHVQDYERALQMLDWHRESEITISEEEFSSFIQDDWGWKMQFTDSNQFYTGSISPSKQKVR